MAFPIFGFIWIQLVFTISLGPSAPDYVEKRNFWSLMCLILVVSVGIMQFVENLLYQYTGEKLTHDVRKKLFKEILHKQVSWFDRRNRASGVLTTLFSDDINKLNGLTTEYLALILQALLSIVAGITISAIFCW